MLTSTAYPDIEPAAAAVIALKSRSGESYKAVTVATLGCLRNAGKVLVDHYNPKFNMPSIEKMFVLGNMLFLSERVEVSEWRVHSLKNPAPGATCFFVRDGGKRIGDNKHLKCKNLSALRQYWKETDFENIYICDGKSWKTIDFYSGSKSELCDLKRVYLDFISNVQF